MKQASLRFSRAPKGNPIARLKDYDEANLRCARIILSERQRYERECGFLVRWALLIIQRLGTEQEKAAAA